MKQILINVEPFEKRVAIINKGVLEEFHIERADQPRLAGNIYKGVVESVVRGIGAVFVDIGTGKNGFLYVDSRVEKAVHALLDEDIAIEESSGRAKNPIEHFRKGQEIVVQIVKEPIGTKGPLLTTEISLPGKYLVLMPFNKTIGISKRIADTKKREELKKLLHEFQLPQGTGCIARTQCVEAKPRQLKLELKYLLNLWARIQKRRERQKAPSAIYEEYDLPLRIIRDGIDAHVEKILVDSKEEYKKIARFAGIVDPLLNRRIFYYRGKTSLYQKYGIEDKIDEIFRRKVFLRSGASIVIEQTESLVAIDVNTGKYKGREHPEETAFKTNMEAAEEIARQVMLRDIGGIIVIDFIDMEDRHYRKQLLEKLTSAFEKDKARINILPLSGIGLIEMTRQRIRKSLESVSFRDCPYCNGMGRVKTPATIAIGAMRSLEQALEEKRTREINFSAHSDVIEYMRTNFLSTLNFLSRKYRKKIILKIDKSLHVENVYIE